MNARRAVLAAAAAWLVVVVVGSALAWAVISRAGDEVSGDSSDLPSTSEDPTTDATPTITGRPSGSGSPTDVTSSPTSTSVPPSTEPVQRTWQGLGGFVVVECRGPAVRLIGAQADPGFVIEVNDRGPDRVEVEFEGQGDHEDEETRARAFCAEGTPTFEVDSDAS